jgi:ABC-2 type transport system permease protein
MYSLFYKEISHFFSTLTGYLVIGVYLIANGLFLWILPGNFNIPDNGYATLESLFVISPWIFIFLVSAVTMRMFADEKRLGTLEVLFTKPISEFEIVMAKYLAAVTLVLFSLLPTLIYFLSVYLLGNPTGNVDTGGTWGSYIGLFFLAAIYVSIGIFSSSLTDNQIIAFIISVVISLLFYIGFDAIATIPLFSNIESVIVLLGINEHYKSISRGVIDLRDIVYFIGVAALFLLFTRTVLQSRKW